MRRREGQAAAAEPLPGGARSASGESDPSVRPPCLSDLSAAAARLRPDSKALLTLGVPAASVKCESASAFVSRFCRLLLSCKAAKLDGNPIPASNAVKKTQAARLPPALSEESARKCPTVFCSVCEGWNKGLDSFCCASYLHSWLSYYTAQAKTQS